MNTQRVENPHSEPKRLLDTDKGILKLNYRQYRPMTIFKPLRTRKTQPRLRHQNYDFQDDNVMNSGTFQFNANDLCEE